MRILRLHWPLVVAIVVLFATIAVLLVLSVKQNDGHFVNALDDTYIHMSIARNFARYGVWGVTRYEFSSSSSSLLWTLLLSAIYLVTTSTWVPLILDLVCAVLSLLVTYSLRGDTINNQVFKAVVLLAIVFMLPLPSLILGGMEHTAQIAIALVFIFTASKVIAGVDFSWQTRNARLLLFLAMLAPLIRYEGLFMVFLACVLLLLRKRILYSLVLGILALTPLAIYGAISVKKGSAFLPNSLILKGGLALTSTAYWSIVLDKLTRNPLCLLLGGLSVCLFFMWRQKGASFWSPSQIRFVLFVGTTVLHFLFAAFGWFYRYEAYLVGLGIVINTTSLVQLYKQYAFLKRFEIFRPLVAATLLLFTGATVLLVNRAVRSATETIPATKNIYEQQYQMARFLQTYYPGASVAANDIGAINFMADIRCLDLLGLGSVEVSKAKLARQYSTEMMAELAREKHVRIAMIYSIWFKDEGGVPREWQKAGKWITPNYIVCGNPVVSFYAVDPADAEPLKRNLQSFSDRLPADVAQAGPYKTSPND